MNKFNPREVAEAPTRTPTWESNREGWKKAGNSKERSRSSQRDPRINKIKINPLLASYLSHTKSGLPDCILLLRRTDKLIKEIKVEKEGLQLMLERTLVDEGELAHKAASFAKNHRIMKLDDEMAAAQKERTKQKDPVSYTHLTLPTICSV